ncbi:hypothetical protein VP01_186g6 [Puccinia sorghi]|uniref:Uncharacterized protein n=1 Tax=Puccinia sorghi TaxID=27349 RepID=A0A0L6VDC2_9BASI|nr:hypothetical protein VP01_186g6 [Puccinia sorghi]
MPTLPPQSVCLDLSEFRRLLTRYRKLDDSINLSLNRSFSILNSSSPQQAPTTQCAEFWKILTGELIYIYILAVPSLIAPLSSAFKIVGRVVKS